MESLPLTASSYFWGVKIRLVAYRGWTTGAFQLCSGCRNKDQKVWDREVATHFSTGNLPDSVWILLYVFLPATPGVPGTYELGVILKAGWDRFRAVSVTLHEFDHLFLLLLFSPGLERVHGLEDESITIVYIPRAIRALLARCFGLLECLGGGQRLCLQYGWLVP